MSTIARRLVTAAAAAAIAVPAVLAAAAPAQAASLCETDCISAATATANTKTISVSVKTTGYVSVSAEIWNTAKTNRVGYGIVKAGTPVWFNAFSFTSSTSGALAQGATYHVKVIAKDMLGKSRTEWLPVRIKQRDARYVITRIDLHDDSDYAGAGEFRAGWKAGTTVKNLWSGVSSKSSGGYWTFSSSNTNAQIIRTKETSSPKVFVELSDDDSWGLNYCGTAFVPDFTSGSNDCADWSTAGAYLALPETSATVPFTLKVAKNAVVKFTVTGKVVQLVY